MTLAHGIRNLADRKGHLKAQVVASTGPSGKTAQSTQRVTLALAKAKKR